MKGFVGGERSSYTKEQCEEYLKKYPQGLSANIMRERLRELSPDSKPPIEYLNDDNGKQADDRQTVKPTIINDNETNKSSGSQKRKVDNKPNINYEPKWDWLDLTWRILLSIGAVALLYVLYSNISWLTSSFFAVGCVYLMREIWDLKI